MFFFGYPLLGARRTPKILWCNTTQQVCITIVPLGWIKSNQSLGAAVQSSDQNKIDPAKADTSIGDINALSKRLVM